MTSTQTRTDPTRTDPTRTEATTRRRRPRTTRTGILVALAVAVLVALTVVGPWNRGAEPAAPPTPDRSAPLRTYLPGGSVYGQQVPEFQRWAIVYGPGSSVYTSQVPHAG